MTISAGRLLQVILINDLPFGDGVLYLTLHPAAGEGGIAGLGGELLRVDGPLLVGVKNHQVGSLSPSGI